MLLFVVQSWPSAKENELLRTSYYYYYYYYYSSQKPIHVRDTACVETRDLHTVVAREVEVGVQSKRVVISLEDTRRKCSNKPAYLSKSIDDFSSQEARPPRHQRDKPSQLSDHNPNWN